jgi:superfamily I DNA/RNA helicase
VWGPPGTGKTRVLRSAIGDLLTAGKRVLLVSGTNVAVDNALHETLKERAFAPGEIVRVGPRTSRRSRTIPRPACR